MVVAALTAVENIAVVPESTGDGASGTLRQRGAPPRYRVKPRKDTSVMSAIYSILLYRA